jgi:hypothetical protein
MFSYGTYLEGPAILCDIADSWGIAPSLCFMSERSCCFAALNDAMEDCSSTMTLVVKS